MTHEQLTPETRARLARLAEVDGKFADVFGEMDRKAEMLAFWFRIFALAVVVAVSFGAGWCSRGVAL